VIQVPDTTLWPEYLVLRAWFDEPLTHVGSRLPAIVRVCRGVGAPVSDARGERSDRVGIALLVLQPSQITSAGCRGAGNGGVRRAANGHSAASNSRCGSPCFGQGRGETAR